MQTLLLDVLDSRKKDELVTSNFQCFKKEYQALKEEIKKYREEFKNVHETLNEGIRQLKATQVDEISKLSSLKNNYLNFSIAVNETLKNIQNDQTAQDIHLKKIHSQLHSGGIPGNYAFYAQLSSSASNNYVVFDNVTTNEGSAYDGTTGIFTCTYSGSYVFSWTIGTISHRYTEAQITVNGDVIGSSGTDSRPESDLADSSTGFVVHNLRVKDSVRVRVNGTANGIYSTFSGWRLPDGSSSFSAKAMSNLSKPSSTSQGFPFESTFNNGSQYDSNKGIFTCSESGLYAFAFVVEASNTKYYNFHLNRTGSNLNNIKVQAWASPGEHLDATLTLQIFNLTQGDTVYVYSHGLDKDIEPFHSTFSGWQIGYQTSNIPAFLVYTSSDTSSKPLNYTVELLDTSSSFSSTYFQAQKDGVYLFFWNIEVYGRRLESFLQVNDATVGRSISYLLSPYYDNSSNLAIVRILKNDYVKVMHDGIATSAMLTGYFLFQ